MDKKHFEKIKLKEMKQAKIYFICPSSVTPTGGVKQIYKQVDILNKNGFNAVILHEHVKYKNKWFENDTRIEYNKSIFQKIGMYFKFRDRKNIKVNFKKFKIYINSLFDKKIEENSILVFPEIFGSIAHYIEPNHKKVIFNQNCYYTYVAYPKDFDYKKSIYNNPTNIGTIVVSEDSRKYLSYLFPSLNLQRIRLGINENLFHYNSAKKRQIAFMPRKLKEDSFQITNILKQKGILNDWKLVMIDDKSETEVAQIMKESYIFLSFNETEGFGLPPAEAMACGCIVIGYSGLGGKEYFNENFSFQVKDRDVIEFVTKIEKVLRLFDDDEEKCIEMGIEASKFILNKYSLINEENDVVTTWNNLIKK